MQIQIHALLYRDHSPNSIVFVSLFFFHHIIYLNALFSGVLPDIRSDSYKLTLFCDM